MATTGYGASAVRTLCHETYNTFQNEVRFRHLFICAELEEWLTQRLSRSSPGRSLNRFQAFELPGTNMYKYFSPFQCEVHEGSFT